MKAENEKEKGGGAMGIATTIIDTQLKGNG